jgi:hypothetical protein
MAVSAGLRTSAVLPSITCYCVMFQRAIKEKNFDVWEIDKDALGTAKEKSPPKKTEAKSKSS